MIKFHKHLIKKVSACGLIGIMSASFALGSVTACSSKSASSGSASNGVSVFNGELDRNEEQFYDESAVTTLPDTVKSDDEISVIVMSNEDALLDGYEDYANSAVTFGDYAVSADAANKKADIASANDDLLSLISASGVSYEYGNTYNVLLAGFEVIIKAGDFDKLCSALGDEATAIVGEVYEECESQVVTNDVNVYEDTGIFDSSDSAYQGDGVVIAVLDTGLDYTHSAFSMDTFSSSDPRMTYSEISSKINMLEAANNSSIGTEGLTADDVYINERLPYAYDYADGDADVFPINSEHGTHVSGVIVGKDDVITGVAPNAQLVTMKVFSDTKSGARTSWILVALEDCVTLGVDVINMSLGTSCGFSREADKDNVNKIYDKIKEQGISLICAASNDYNATYGSTKNGNNPLTSNPDSGTVGSPSTYDAALSVASISGKKRSYILYNGEVMYFNEGSDSAAEAKDFVEDLLDDGVETQEYEYVTVPGTGTSGDYTGLDVTGKIALVRRGTTTFEEKIRNAQRKGAVGIIIYNNVSGDISMSVGDVNIAACSISQDDGEKLAANATGTITVSRTQKAGPFMSDFSSWGPTGDLKIKPEITAHGGDIYSCVPGQRYEKMSGTSMAAPNQAGVTALVRQYVKEKWPDLTAKQVTARVNQLMMSTADIAYNTNGLPYAVRKQGAGVTNLTAATMAEAYVTTFEDGEEMDKTKLELGDDKNRTGSYQMTFAINNITSSSVTYEVGALVQTEGVSSTKTHQGDTTVTMQGYALNPESVSVTSVTGGTQAGNKVTVAGNGTATVTFEIVLSDEDKEYLNESFKYGMYIEGFVTLTAEGGATVDLNVPYLAFYGDWTEAPLYDLDYFETNKDELDDSIDTLDKTMADAYATRPVGGLNLDYIRYLGSYAFVQDPSSTMISADRKYISLSNQSEAVNSLEYVYAGLLRNAKSAEIVITEESTGNVIFTSTDVNISKSRHSGSTIYGSSIDVDFSVLEYDLKNNTKYNVKVTTYLDYGDGGAATNAKNTFEFPFVTDFQSPAVTGQRFYTEYDRSSKKTRLYVEVDVYDNHYAMAAQFGTITQTSSGYSLNTFGKYLSQVYSDYNSTSKVTMELTDYIDEIKGSYNNQSIICVVYDYAYNYGYYELEIPQEIQDIYFAETEITLQPNQIYTLEADVYPTTEWAAMLNYEVENEAVCRVVNGKIVALAAGTTTVTAYSPADNSVSAAITVTVTDGEGYSKTAYDSFRITGYTTNKAYYLVSSSDREIGITGQTTEYLSTTDSFSLSMYPSESVTLNYKLVSYYPDDTKVVFTSNNESIVTIDENGTVVAQEEGVSSVTVRVMIKGDDGEYTAVRGGSKTISVTVKNPYVRSGPYLTAYRGTGVDGVVEVDADLKFTQISSYAFSGYNYVEKDSSEISEEDPYNTKQWYIGNSDIKKVVLPEGIELIDTYAFANMTALEEIVLPSTLKKINAYAFYGCTSLKKITGLENVQFINQYAFANCALTEVKLDSLVALGNYAFYGNDIYQLTLPATAQSIGAYAFAGNGNLWKVSINATKIKLGNGAFGQTALKEISVNASVIPEYAFYGCSSLATVYLGADVSTIGQNAFTGTAVTKFIVSSQNQNYSASSDGLSILDKTGKKLVMVSPTVGTTFSLSGVTEIGAYALSGITTLRTVSMPDVAVVGDGAFYGSTSLRTATLGTLTKIGEYAFAKTAITSVPDITHLEDKTIGAYAFMSTSVTEVTIPEGYTVGEGAFMYCTAITSVTAGDNVTLGNGAFFAKYTSDSTTGEMTFTTSLSSVTLGAKASIGNYAFYGATSLSSVTLGDGASIGNYAFFNNSSLKAIDLSKVVSIGTYAFSGQIVPHYTTTSSGYSQVDGYYLYATPLTEVDLSSCQSLGAYAFCYNRYLTKLNLGSTLGSIGNRAFFYCRSLAEISGGDNITAAGDYAFYYNEALTEVNLPKLAELGSGAFYACEALERVTLSAEGSVIGSSAFYGCSALTEVTNLNLCSSIGDYAFVGVGITSANLDNVVYLGECAFAESALTSVSFGEEAKIADIGDNPFYGCNIPAFSVDEKVDFGGEGSKTYTEKNYTYEINDYLKVYSGVLYSKETDGLQLVSYPLGKTDVTEYVVEDDTVRISAYAFAGTSVRNVVLPLSLKAIGDKAFYKCSSLARVTFKSVEAPVLEETYDESYITLSHLPFSGSYYGYEGLGIVPTYMWNITSTYTAFYFGANFVDYIGQKTSDLEMVYPSNGKYYDSFIYGNYFTSTVVAGASPTEATLSVIDLISAIPTKVALNSETGVITGEAEINAAQAAYDALSTEQQALVTNISRLNSATTTLNYIKSQKDSDDNTDDSDKNEDVNKGCSNSSTVVLSVFLGVVVALACVEAVLLFRRKSANKGKEE